MSNDKKKIQNPADFLKNEGLLFEINRHLLHPFGLSMETDNENRFSITDYRESKEHVFYEEEAFIEQLEKANHFLRSEGIVEANRRREELGFSIQPLPDPHVYRNGVRLMASLQTGTVEFRVPLLWLEREVLERHNAPIELFVMNHDVEQSTSLYWEAKKQNALMAEAGTGPLQ